jgi:signal transduction histidine kinase
VPAPRTAETNPPSSSDDELLAEAAFLRDAAPRIEQEMFRRRFANWRMTLGGMTCLAWMIAGMYGFLYPAAATLRWALFQTLAFVLVGALCLVYERRRPVDLASARQRRWIYGWTVASALTSAIAGLLPWFLPADNLDAQLSSAALVSILMVAFVVSRSTQLLIFASVGALAFHARLPLAVPVCLTYTGLLLAMGLMVNAALRRAIGEQQFARHLHGEARRSHVRQLAVQQREVALNERQRMMSDLHDGFGAQLIGSLRQLESGHIGVDGAIGALRECIDDLRLTVDAHEPAARSLATLLGMLRFRMQPRIEATGLRLTWHIEDLPESAALPAAHSLDLLRILQQGIANVLQHAAAQEISIGARRAPRQLEIAVEDDGKGMDPVAATKSGRGIASMQRRAARLGAELLLEPRAEGGTALRLRLRWPPDGMT